MSDSKQIAVVGGGISGLSAAATLASKGLKVSVFEKNEQLGGRLRQFKASGFTFDMGPSWYWMPDVFEKFYNRFGYTTSDFYELKKLDPGFQIIFQDGESMKIPSEWVDILEMFEVIERGSASRLMKFMDGAEFKYGVGVNKLVYSPGLKLSELISPDVLRGIIKLQVFTSLSKHVRKYFKNKKLVTLMEFPMLFLGAEARKIPAFYSFMNYACLKQGTFYPVGGFYKVVEALTKICNEAGVEFHLSDPVQSISSGKGSILLTSSKTKARYDALIASADYNHVESSLLDDADKNYSDRYWKTRAMSPSCLLFYVGVKRKVEKLEHHNLFFDEDFDQHSDEIYKDPKWPSNPLFYVCCPSKTDASVCPEGKENLFILMPVAPGLPDSEEIRDVYYRKIMERLHKYTGVLVSDHIEYCRSYCLRDFMNDYNSFKGNAYGLANTLMQTANLKPKIKNRSIDNFYYTGHLTVPGPGVPPALISGQVAATELIKNMSLR